MKIKARILLIALLLSVQSPGQANLISAQADADQLVAGLAILPGIVGSLERTIVPGIAAGFSLGLIGNSDLYVGQDKFGRYNKGDFFGEAHGNFRFLKQSTDLPVDMAAILGAFLDKNGTHFQYGAIMDLYFTQKITARFNLTTGPRFGVEMGYLVEDRLELNITLGSAMAMAGFKLFGIPPRRLRTERR